MRLFENYASGIEDILKGNQISNFSGVTNKRSMSTDILKGVPSVRMFSQLNENQQLTGDKALLEFDKNGLQELFGPNRSSFSNIVIGSHPDFSDLSHDSCCYHHCVSMFVDIKGSTRLGLKHSLEKVRLIKDSMLTLCIHVANFFGGHIHRLQGDAVFVQFVRKGHYKNDAVINAINAASVLCQFVEKDLSDVFSRNGLDPIKIRIGIDYGNDKQVLWSHYGVPGCAELTTTSLHTDLAAKLQGKAGSNGIVVGANVINEIDLPEDYYGFVYQTGTSGVSVEDRYIVNATDFRYRQQEFLWRKYLLSYDFIKKDGTGRGLEIADRDFRIKCVISNPDGSQAEEYHQNSRSIDKRKKITFVIMYRGAPYHKQAFEHIVWEAVNRGTQAKDAGQLAHSFGELYKDSTTCETEAAYLGHHYVSCKMARGHLGNVNLTFPIFVR